MKNHVVTVKPQLVRRHLKVQTQPNITVVVRPTQPRVVNLRDLRPKKTAKPIPPPSPKKQVRDAAIKTQKLLRRRTKQAQVRYITADASPESARRVAAIKGIGKGKVIVILGNGPSLGEVDVARLKDHHKIDLLTINKPDPRVWPTTYWAFFDLSQYRRNENLWNSYTGTIFNSTAIKRQKATSMQFKNIGGRGWSRDMMQGLYIGRSSVYAAMQIAAWMSYEHVYILGCDMNPDGLNGQLHFYGSNPDVTPEVRKNRFAKEAEHYSLAAEILSPEERAKFTFCSAYNPWEFVNKFNKLDHREAVATILAKTEGL